MAIQENGREQTPFQAHHSSQWTDHSGKSYRSRRQICSGWFVNCFRRLEFPRSELVMKGASASRTFMHLRLFIFDAIDRHLGTVIVPFFSRELNHKDRNPKKKAMRQKVP